MTNEEGKIVAQTALDAVGRAEEYGDTYADLKAVHVVLVLESASEGVQVFSTTTELDA